LSFGQRTSVRSVFKDRQFGQLDRLASGGTGFGRPAFGGLGGIMALLADCASVPERSVIAIGGLSILVLLMAVAK